MIRFENTHVQYCRWFGLKILNLQYCRWFGLKILMCSVIDDSVWRDSCALLYMTRFEETHVQYCRWSVQQHYPSHRCPFKKRKRLLKVFFLCAIQLIQLFRKYAPPEMLFYKFAAYLQNTYFEEHSRLSASKRRCFLWVGVLGNTPKNFLELLC